MTQKDKQPVSSALPTMCSVCAWRKDCVKKFSYSQGSAFKCADYTRDLTLPAQEDNQ